MSFSLIDEEICWETRMDTYQLVIGSRVATLVSCEGKTCAWVRLIGKGTNVARVVGVGPLEQY